MSLLKNAMSLLLKRLIQKRLQPWRRSGGAAAEMGTHDGTARTSERRVHTRAGMERGARGEGEGLLHHGSSGTRWGCAQDAGQPALPTHRQREEDLRLRTRRRLPGTGQRPTRHGQAEDHAKASWRTRAGAIGGGSAASFRCRRILRITSPCVRAAMTRSAPR
jgi:hypothetical protein